MITYNDSCEYITTLKNGTASCGHEVSLFHNKENQYQLKFLLNQLENDCAICLLPITLADRKIAIINNCRHVFHYDACLWVYLLTQDDYYCCLCRQEILTIDIYNSITDFIVNECDLCNQASCLNNEHKNKLYIRQTPIQELQLSRIIDRQNIILIDLEATFLPITKYKNNMDELKKLVFSRLESILEANKLGDMETKIHKLSPDIRNDPILAFDRQDRKKRFVAVGDALYQAVYYYDASYLERARMLITHYLGF
jgi:hypothetical protein